MKRNVTYLKSQTLQLLLLLPDDQQDPSSLSARPLLTGIDPTAQSRAPYPAGSAASTAAPAASYPQAHAAPEATTTSATTMSCTAAAPAAAYVAAAYVAATAMASAASPCKPYAGAKFSFFVENVKGPQAHIKHFYLGEKNALPRVLGRHVYCRRVC